MTNFEQVLIDALCVTEDLHSNAVSQVESIQKQIEELNDKLVRATDVLVAQEVDLMKAKKAIKAVMPNYFDAPVVKPVIDKEATMMGVHLNTWQNKCADALNTAEVVKVTKLEYAFLSALAEGMYAEPGFSDMGLEDVMNNIHKEGLFQERGIGTWKAVMGSLVKKGLVHSDEFESMDAMTGKDTHHHIIYLHYSVYAFAGLLNKEIAYWPFKWEEEGKVTFTLNDTQVHPVKY